MERRTERSERRRAWLGVALWIGVIFFFSQGTFSAELTRQGFGPLMRLLGISPQTAWKIHFFIRKGAHVAEYTVLGFLVWRAIALQGLPGPALAWGLGLALGVAAIDETHQAFHPLRTGSTRDVGLDVAGAGLGLAMRRLVSRRPPAAAARAEARPA